MFKKNIPVGSDRNFLPFRERLDILEWEENFNAINEQVDVVHLFGFPFNGKMVPDFAGKVPKRERGTLKEVQGYALPVVYLNMIAVSLAR